MIHPANVDVAVVVLFFNRPEHLRRLFESIKQARPSKLLLYQDGARSDADMPKMEECRAVVADSEIDWQCEVHRNYQLRNAGCDPSSYNCI